MTEPEPDGARLLTVDLLERLRERWVENRAPVVRYLRPGLTADRIDKTTAELGLRLPVEARIWWGWHDGVDVTVGPSAEIGPSLWFFPLQHAASMCHLFREHAQAWGEQAEHWWRRSWFPITERQGAIRCDCAVEEGAPTPIYYADSHDYDVRGLTIPKLDSFRTLVTWWIDALESGAWRYNAENQRWERHRGLLPPDRQRSGLM